MKRNDKLDLRSKTVDELLRMETDLREEILKIKTEDALKKLKNTNSVRLKSKDLARVLTVLSMKQESIMDSKIIQDTTEEKPKKEEKNV